MRAQKKFDGWAGSSLGRLIGVSALALLCRYYPPFEGLSEGVLGIIFGCVISRSVARSVYLIVSPVLRFGAYCEKLLEIWITLKAGIIDREKCEEVVSHLVDQRFGVSKAVNYRLSFERDGSLTGDV